MARKSQDLENHIREIRKQLGEQVSCLDVRSESKLSLLADLKDFYKKRGEVEFEYAKNLERLCERFERNTKQRNIKHELRSTFNLWSTLLAETRRMARDRANLAEVLSVEMGARLDIMSKDVQFLTRKCKELCTEVQENLMKELKELNEQSKLYQYACHHCTEAHTKHLKSLEKVEQAKNSAVRRKKAEEKEKERRRQYNEQRNRLLKTRNDYLLRVASSNARSLHFYSTDVMNIVEFMDHDYHDSFKRLTQAYSDAEQGSCNLVVKATNTLVDQAKTLNFENDLHYFMSEFSGIFTQPPEFQFVLFGDDDVTEYKVNIKDVFLRAQEVVKNFSEELKTLQLQTDEDNKTIEHMSSKNLCKYKVQTIDDALKVLEEAGEPLPPETSSRYTSLDRGSLATTTRGALALFSSQKGKEDTFSFTLGVFARKLARAAQLNVTSAKLSIVDKSLSEQKVPPISVDGDYRVPKLFGGDCLEYIMATGLNIPLVLSSCCDAILKEGLTTEGLFRVPGPAQQIDDLKKSFEEGRDPLAYSAVRNIEITAVASVLKLYFRELVNPLFPCEKYYDFIKCARKEDPQDRLDCIRDTTNQLHPSICIVMRYLFRFLNRVSEHYNETKMNSANLALVFGPTLTRAPDKADPRLLHNDVPAINALIQLCIEHHDYIFGEDSEDEGRLASPPPPPVPAESSLLGTSPNDAAMHYESSSPPPPTLDDDEEEEPDDELCELPIPELPSINEMEPPTFHEEEPPTVGTFIQAAPPPVETPVTEPPVIDEPVEPPPTLVNEPSDTDEQQVYKPPPVAMQPEATPIENQPVQEVPQAEATVEEEEPLPAETQPTSAEGHPVPPDGLSTQVSTVSVTKDINFLDQALQDIEMSIEEMKDRPSSRGGGNETLPAVVIKEDEEDEESEESDTEEVMTISARALYGYSARTEKELTFSKGDMLDVIDKTPDGNWWDGFRSGKRGYIPVKYVEITELHATPVPPQRKSSMNKEEADSSSTPSPKPTSIPEEDTSVKILSEDIKTDVQTTKPVEAVTTATEETPPTKVESSHAPTSSPKHSPEESPKRKKPSVPVKTGAVSKLTQQFQQPTPPAPPPQQRVLVGPHKTHTRYPSADMNKGAQEGAGPPRSNSSGASSKPQVKPPMVATHPPPIRPKPDKEPSTSPFPLMSHDTHVSASPLQKAHLQGQVSKPQPVAAKKGSVFRGSGKKEKPPLPSKPQPPAKTAGTLQLQAELSAVTARRRKPEGDAS